VGKHRGGDPLKSLRFAHRATELYEQGLARWPRNLDLAYNKARLELEVATHPGLSRHLDVPVVEVLRRSLASHEYALSLDQDNADALFNAAQVLTAVAELIARDEGVSDAEALRCLEQALQYQERCLQIQKEKYAEARTVHEEAARIRLEGYEDDDDDGGAQIDANMRTSYEDREEEEEQWVSVVEPVTANTLVDTILAQLSTLTTLCSILNSSLATTGSLPASSVSLQWIEACSTKILTGELPEVQNASSEKDSEIALTKAILAANFLELAFRSRSIEIDVYKDELEKAFSAPDESADAQLAYARALIALNSALSDTWSGSEGAGQHGNIRWNALSKAQRLLTSAASAAKADTDTLATTHMLRGDASLLLFALSYPPASFAQAKANAPQLLRNAEVFYRNANKLFGTLGEDAQEEQQTAAFRGAVVEVLQSGGLNAADAERVLASASMGKSDGWRREQLQDIIDEGLARAEIFGMS